MAFLKEFRGLPGFFNRFHERLKGSEHHSRAFKGVPRDSKAFQRLSRAFQRISSGFSDVLGDLNGISGHSRVFQVSKAFQEHSKSIPSVFKEMQERFKGISARSKA